MPIYFNAFAYEIVVGVDDEQGELAAFPRFGAFQVVFVPLSFLTFDGFIGLLHSVEIDIASPIPFGTHRGELFAIR
jgi:hypothetical protein